MAFLYEFREKYEEAEPLYKRALTINEKVSGPEHPDVVEIRNKLDKLSKIIDGFSP